MDDKGRESFQSIEQLIRRRAITHHDAGLISYQTKGGEFLDFTGVALEQITGLAARHYAACIPLRREGNLINVALVGKSGWDYYVAFLALQRAGCTTVFISPRLADQGFEHLLTTTGCTAAIVAPNSMPTMQRVIGSLNTKVALVPLATSDTLLSDLPQNSAPGIEASFEGHYAAQEFIIHSGGTTGLPKPVPLKPESWLRQAGDIAARMSRVEALTTLPLFHSFGFATLLRCLVNGKRLSILDADRPITATHIMSALDATHAQALVTVPYILKFFTEAENGVSTLADLQQVIAAGSAIPDEPGDHLVENGVNIFHLYGQTESGALMEPSKGSCKWVTPLPHAEPYLRFEPTDEGLFHLVILPGLKAKVHSTRENGEYETKDLFERHPEDPRKWKFAARQDDIIVLVNGEKADPMPLENAVGQNANVGAALAFGSQRDSLGLIVVLSESASDMSEEHVLRSLLIDLERGNSKVPTYAKVPADGLILKPADTELPTTDKGTVIRSRALKQFKSDIAAYYAAREKALHRGEEVQDRDIAGVVRQLVVQVLKLDDNGSTALTDVSDFFSLGMDSLQASNLRSSLTKEIAVEGRRLPTNVVFEHPNIQSLTGYLLAMRHGSTGVLQSTEALAQDLIQKYSVPKELQSEMVNNGEAQVYQGQCVLLTGASGFVGSHILQNLLLDEKVTSIHCLVRASDPAAAQSRITESLRKCRLLPSIPAAAFEKLCAHPSNFSASDLGLPRYLCEELRRSVTNVIHNAWQVNFNLSLASFEEQSIRSTAFLLSLAASSLHRPKPVFTLVSSIAVGLRHPAGHAKESNGIPETLLSWDHVEPMGYAQSKFVGEQVAAAADLPVRIVRLGQICGDTVNGYWNPSEAIPRTVQAAYTIGALSLIEGDDEELDWLPVDIAASALAKLSMANVAHEETSPRVFHLVNKRRMDWNADFLTSLKASGLPFDAVPQRQWLEMLRKSNLPAADNPPMQLLDFFVQKYEAPITRQPPHFDMTETAKVVSEVKEGFSIGEVMVGKFLEHWKLP